MDYRGTQNCILQELNTSMETDGKHGKNATDGGHPSHDSHSSHPIIPPRGDYQTLLSTESRSSCDIKPALAPASAIEKTRRKE
jgi:hypothetical protein